MQAITTKFLGATNFHGSRIKATCQAKSVTLSWSYDLSIEGNHTAAAKALAIDLGWGGTWISGALPDGTGNCFVNVGNPDGAFTLPKKAGER